MTETNRFGSQGSWMTIGGTSLGSPAWAASSRSPIRVGRSPAKASLDGPTQTLPSLYAAPSSDFNTVAAASSSFGGGFGLRLRLRLSPAPLWFGGPGPTEAPASGANSTRPQHGDRCEHGDGARFPQRPGPLGRPRGKHPHDAFDTSIRQRWRHNTRRARHHPRNP